MFFIAEAGARIHTPMAQLFKRQGVEPLDKTSAAKAVDEEDEAPAQPQSQSRARHQHLVEAYEEVEEEAEARHRIKFAHEIMSAPVITGRIDQPLFEVWGLFAKRGVHHLPILDTDQQLQGIVSDRDILRLAANTRKALTDRPIQELMTKAVVCATVDTEVRDLAEVMVRRSIGAIPLVDDEHRVKGIVSRTDILRTLVHRAPLDLWT